MSYESSTKISQLPEKTDLPSSTDYMVVESENPKLDTYKIKTQLFYDYINQNMTNLSALVSNKLTEVDNTIATVNKAEANRNSTFESWSLLETNRETAEETRENNENSRKETWQEWVDYQADMVASEDQRQAAESYRENTWNTWNTFYANVANQEVKRNTFFNETIERENTRINNETQRITDESTRQQGYVEMVNYINELKALIDSGDIGGGSGSNIAGHSLECTSATVNACKIMDITINNTYAGESFYSLLNIAFTKNNTISQSGIISVDITPRMTNYNHAVTMFYSSWDSISSSKVLAKVQKNDTNSVISVYLLLDESETVEYVLLHSNLSSIESDDFKLTDYNNIEPVALEDKTGTLPVLFNETIKAEQKKYPLFYQYFNITQTLYQLLTESSAPNVLYTNYPIGSIYESTTNTNPADSLGGGTWELMYGKAITDTYINTATNESVSETIYKWKRTK